MFWLATVLMLQSTGMISDYADNVEDLFENVDKVQQNSLEWQQQEPPIQPVKFIPSAQILVVFDDQASLKRSRIDY